MKYRAWGQFVLTSIGSEESDIVETEQTARVAIGDIAVFYTGNLLKWAGISGALTTQQKCKT